MMRDKCAVVMTGLIAAIFLVISTAAAKSQDPPADGQTFSASVGQRVVELIGLEAEEEWSEAISGYTALLAGSRLSDFERASILKIRGAAQYQLGQITATVSDWRSALQIQALSAEDTNTLRLNTGQLLMGEGEIGAGIELIQLALSEGVTLSADIAMRLAQGYAQLEEYGPGLGFAQQAFDLAEPRLQRHYSMLLYYFQTLEMEPEQLELIAEMVAQWPQEKRYWTSYASLLARAGREEEAFQVNVIMYLDGMLTSSAEIVRLAQYYSFYEYPFRGGAILERELNAGRVDPTPVNYALLANTWRQAREWERALPVLQRVATMTGTGPDYVKLGEAHYQAGQYQEAEAVFVQALTRSDLDRPGDTWNLLGMVRVELDEWLPAMEAYEEGLRWEYSRAGAQGWLDFIERKIALEQQADRLAQQVRFEGCEIEVEAVRREFTFRRDPQYDAEGRPILRIREDCLTFFDEYGDVRPEFERA
jgi:tetratricopeptide (TPR) repeat protein